MIQQWREQKAKAFERMEKLMKRDNGKLTPTEQREYNEVHAEFKEAISKINEIEEFQRQEGLKRKTRISFINHNVDERAHTLGKVFKAVAGTGGDEYRTLVSSGSALIQDPNVVDNVVYTLQATNPLTNAGVQIVNTENNRQVPKITAFPTAQWLAEGDQITPSDPTISSVKWSLKDVAVLIKVQNQVLMDSAVNTEKIISEVAAKAINDAALEVVFSGTSANNQPTGIDGYTNVLEVSMGTDGAAITDYTKLVSAAKKLMDVNIMKNDISYIYNPTVAEQIANLKDTTNQPLQPPKFIEDLKYFETTAVKSTYTQGATSNTTRIYVGDFSKMVIGIGGTFQLKLVEKYSDYLQTGFLMHFRVDVQPLFENAYCIVKGVTTS